MNRRAFVTGLGAVLAAAVHTGAQQSASVYRIGVLETTSPALNTANLDAFRRGLRELGYVEGRNLIIDYRSADGRSERFRDLAVELVRRPVDVIVTRGTPAALAAKNATGTIPIVMAAIGEPLDTGVVATLARPGGNVTGLPSFGSELMAKRLELLKEAVPRAAQIAALLNMSNPVAPSQWKEIEKAARSLGIQAQLFTRTAHVGRLPVSILASVRPFRWRRTMPYTAAESQ